jgi:hypothetical protein
MTNEFAVAPDIHECQWCDHQPLPRFPTMEALREHIVIVHRTGGWEGHPSQQLEFCDEAYCPGNCHENGECPGEAS